MAEFDTADKLWERLSPINPIKPAPSDFIYRGQRDASWPLQPSVLRPENNPAQKLFGTLAINADNQVFAEMLILERFAQTCDLVGLKLPNDSIKFRELNLNHPRADKYYIDPSKWPNEELIELMALAQHHRLPTRLLDWSRRSYVAAYFAASFALSKRNEWKKDDRLAVWALDVHHIHLYKKVSLIKVPGSTSVNLAAQAGVFTLLKQEGTRRSPLVTKYLDEEFKTLPNTPLWKFTLPVTHSTRILELCELYGINAASLFPGYDGVVKAVFDHINMWRKLEDK